MRTARVTRENKTNYVIVDSGKELTAVIRGKFHLGDQGFPKVGDYVEYLETALGEAVIESILPRRTTIVRKSAGDSTDEQVLVTNVDLMFVVMGLDDDFNIKRLERYMLLAEQSGIKAVIVLNKRDVVPDPETFLKEVQKRFPGTDVYLVSAANGTNMERLQEHLGPEVTAVLLGSSGAGKSTITNWLLRQKVQETQGVREDDARGRHTTTARQLFSLPEGGYLIDTPGIRELGLMGEVTGEVFAEIEELQKQCKFRDCDHEKSAGCAVQRAVSEGTLEPEQLANYIKLGKEKAFLETRGDPEAEWRKTQEERKLTKKHFKIKQEKYKKQ